MRFHDVSSFFAAVATAVAVFVSSLGGPAFAKGNPALNECRAALDSCTATSQSCESSRQACENDLSRCSADLALCTAGECGNGFIEYGESCDGANLQALTCASFGIPYGELSCADNCELVLSECTTERYVDTGATIIDHETGLEWVKQNDAGGFFDKDAILNWPSAMGDYVSTLNGMALGGHTDWRLPNVAELRTILDMSAAGCGSGAPCVTAPFNAACTAGCTSCSCTALPNYWSSVTNGSPTTTAIVLNFNLGIEFATDKVSAFQHVRGVRTRSQ
jgi:hypothetical protein